MSERGAEFLLSWVAEHIRSADYPPEGDKAQAQTRAAECLAAAEASGLSRAELEAEVGPLADYMHVMMSTPTELNIQFRSEGDDVTLH